MILIDSPRVNLQIIQITIMMIRLGFKSRMIVLFCLVITQQIAARKIKSHDIEITTSKYIFSRTLNKESWSQDYNK